MEFTGSKYIGPCVNGRFDGRGTFLFPDGTKYVGEFKDGEMHGEGEVFTADGGVYSARFEHGNEVVGAFAFADGLKFKASDWKYLTPEDRRYFAEMTAGEIRPAGDTRVTARDPPPRVPRGCYDAGDGIFDSVRGVIVDYDTGEKVRDPDGEERKWIVDMCRRSDE